MAEALGWRSRAYSALQPIGFHPRWWPCPDAHPRGARELSLPRSGILGLAQPFHEPETSVKDLI
jgi:hypothetical protein